MYHGITILIIYGMEKGAVGLHSMHTRTISQSISQSDGRVVDLAQTFKFYLYANTLVLFLCLQSPPPSA